VAKSITFLMCFANLSCFLIFSGKWPTSVTPVLYQVASPPKSKHGKQNNTFLTSQPHSQLCLEYISGLNFLWYALFLLDDVLTICKSGRRRTWFFTSLFLLKHNWEKVICCKYDTLPLFFVHSLSEPTNSQHNRIINHSLTTTQNRLWYRNQSKRTWYRASVFTISRLHSVQHGCGLWQWTASHTTALRALFSWPASRAANLAAGWRLKTKHYFPLYGSAVS
jgi:hypothetical protein